MNYNDFENRIGYKFKAPKLLREAFTHSSYANELLQKNIPIRSSERLEFLGDAVLELISSTYIFEEFPDLSEGELTPLRSTIVCTKALSAYAKKLKIGELLILSKGESHEGKNKDTNLEDAFEALLGAIYLDSGCILDEVKKFLLPFLSEKVKEIRKCTKTGFNALLAENTVDPKSRLQQIIQETPGEELKYIETDRKGPPHAPIFTVNALLNSNVIGTGVGSSKKQAEQNAAREALKKFFHTF